MDISSCSDELLQPPFPIYYNEAENSISVSNKEQSKCEVFKLYFSIRICIATSQSL